MKRLLSFSTVFVLILAFQAKLFGQFELDRDFIELVKSSVVSIEKIKRIDGKDTIEPHGTGFFMADIALGLFLVTNKHLLLNKDQIAASLYPMHGEKSTTIRIPLTKSNHSTWMGHPDSMVDIGVIKFDRNFPLNKFHSAMVPLSQIAPDSTVIEGDEVVFLGFPMGIRSVEISVPMFRVGHIALKPTENIIWVKGGMESLGKNLYILDAQSTGGNSGSPVFKKFTQLLISKEKGLGYVSTFKLVGIVSGHLDDKEKIEVAQRDSLYSRYATGLAIVHPAFQIEETIRLAANDNNTVAVPIP